MRIGIDIRDLRIAKTGQRTYLEELCRNLPQVVLESDTVFFLDDPLFIKQRKNKIYKIIGHIQYFIWKQVLLPILALVKRCDVVICSDYVTPYFRYRVRYLPVFHDAFFWESAEHYNKLWRGYFNFIAIRGAIKSDLIVTTSMYAKKRLHELLHFDFDKIHVIYQGAKNIPIKSTTCSNLPNTLTANMYFLHVGVLEKRKNLIVLLTAFNSIINLLPYDFNLVLVGQPGPKDDLDDSGNLLKFVEDNNLQTRVIFLGYLSNAELDAVYRNAFCFIFPSVNEGFGIPIVEAYTYGLLLLCSNSSALPEIAGDAALYFTPSDSEELSKLMLDVYINKNNYQHYINRGKERLENFKWVNTATDFYKLIKRQIDVS